MSAVRGRIAVLDGWRGVSIAMVVAGHLMDWHYRQTPNISGPGSALSFWGVSIFFIISGFIITKHALREYAETGGFSIRDFYIRRFFRIVPPFYLYLVTIVVLAHFSLINLPKWEALTAGLFLCNFPQVGCSWFVQHTWTLAFEEQFYLLFPLFFIVVVPNAGFMFGALCLALYALPGYLGFDGLAQFSRIFLMISIGSVMACNEVAIKAWVIARGRFINYVSWLAALLPVLAVVTALMFDIRDVIVIQSLYGAFLPWGLAWLIGGSMYQSNLLTRMLTTRPLLFLGAISYSLYLWQQLFTSSYGNYVGSDFIYYGTPFMFVAATVSYYYVEQPSMRLGKRLIAWLDRYGEVAEPDLMHRPRNPADGNVSRVQVSPSPPFAPPLRSGESRATASLPSGT